MITEKEKKYLRPFKPYFRRKYLKVKKSFGYVSGEYGLKPFEDNECIFVHIPKTGGVSVSKTLFGNLAGGHCTVKDYYFLFGKKRYKEMFSFAFTRNPFTRLASAYRFLKKGGMNKQDQIWSKRYLSKYDSINDFVVNGLRKKEIRSWIHFKSQVDFLYGDNGIDINFIGKMEKIRSHFGHVKNKLGIEKKLKHENRTKSNKKNDIYNEKSKKIIEDVYEDDFDRLGYTKGD